MRRKKSDLLRCTPRALPAGRINRPSAYHMYGRSPVKNTTPCISNFLLSHLGASPGLFARASKFKGENSQKPVEFVSGFLSSLD